MMPRAKKSFGQNFLVDQNVVRKIIQAAELKPDETVLEVGPGTGVLTQALVGAGAHVIAVEADRDLIGPLREKFGERIELIHADILTLTPADARLPPAYKLVANIPYNITSDFLQRFLTADPKPSRMVLMLQREVADRIVAQPPDMSLLSVVCQMYATVATVANVPKGAFRPVPKVHSAVVRFDLLPSADGFQPERIISMAKIGFSHPRKQLHRNLSDAHVASSDRVKAVLADLGLPATARAENVSTQQWKTLASALS